MLEIKNFRIGTKLTFGFLAVSVITLMIGAIGYGFINQMDRAVVGMKQEGREALAVENMRVHFLLEYKYFKDYLFGGGTENIGRYYVKKEIFNAQRKEVEMYVKSQNDNEKIKAISAVNREVQILEAMADKILDSLEIGEGELAQELVRQGVMMQVATVDDWLAALQQMEEADLESAQVMANHVALQARLIMFLCVVLTFVVSMLLGMRVSTTTIDALHNLLSGIKRIEEGDFKHKIPVLDNDELGEVSRAFNRMTQKVQKAQNSLSRKVKKIGSQKESLESLTHDLEKFQLAVDGASDHVTIARADQKIFYANKSAHKITGYTNREIEGRQILWTKDLKAIERQRIMDHVFKKKKVFMGDMEGVRKDGEKYYSEVQISPLIDSKGHVRFVVVIDRDVTKAKAVDRMKTEFVSLASHQLRTPLSAIRWMLEMLIDGELGEMNPEQKDILEQTLESNSRMIMLVNNLLNVASLDKGTLVHETQILDLNKLSRSIMKEMKPLVDQKKIKLELINEVEDAKSSEALVDENVFTQVLENLISNAIKYTPKGGKIMVRITANTRHVQCEVVDNGLGIPKLEQARVFKQFFRASNVVKTDTQGSGLGLYIVKLMVEFSGGSIGFRSKENRGTTFWFKLPKAR